MKIERFFLIAFALAAPVGLGYAADGAIRPGEERIVFTAHVKKLRKGGEDSELDELDIFSLRTDGTGLVRLTSDDLDSCAALWNGGPIVFLRGDRYRQGDPKGPYRSIWIMDADGGNQRELVRRPSGAEGFGPSCFSPDGTRLVYWVKRPGEGSSSILSSHLMDIATGHTQCLPLRDDECPMCWSPDGRSLVFGGGDGYPGDYRFSTYDLENGEIRELLPAAKRHYRMLARLSPDGRRLVFHQSRHKDREIRILDVETGSISPPLASEKRFPYVDYPAWSLDGKYIYFNRRVEGGWGYSTIFRIPADGSGEAARIAGLPETGYAGQANVAVVRAGPSAHACPEPPPAPESVSEEAPPLSVTLEAGPIDDEGRVALTACVTGAEAPATFTWSLPDEEDWVTLTASGSSATLEFVCYSPCTVEVVVTDADSRSAGASLLVDPQEPVPVAPIPARSGDTIF